MVTADHGRTFDQFWSDRHASRRRSGASSPSLSLKGTFSGEPEKRLRDALPDLRGADVEHSGVTAQRSGVSQLGYGFPKAALRPSSPRRLRYLQCYCCRAISTSDDYRIHLLGQGMDRLRFDAAQSMRCLLASLMFLAVTCILPDSYLWPGPSESQANAGESQRGQSPLGL